MSDPVASSIASPSAIVEPTVVVRVISRLNVGGPAIQVITLTQRLAALGYRTVLARGVEGDREGSMDGLAARLAVEPVLVPTLRRELGRGDVRALIALVRLLRRERPAIVHTHAAKAGALGRAAALIATRRRPVLVHTFHGHVLEGYFSPRKARFFTGIERLLARRSDCLVTVSEEVRGDLVRLGVAPPERIVVVRLGFDLSPFVIADAERAARRLAFRRLHGIPTDARVVSLVARLVPIKRVDRFLRVACLLASMPTTEDLVFVVAGDGELAEELRASTEAAALGASLRWIGMTDDVAAVCFASEVVVLTSDNEGTPVSLIEAQAAAVPVVATDVGGCRSVVRDGATGLLVGRDDDAGFARSVASLVDDRALAAAFGEAGRLHVCEQYSLDRLVADIDRLYRDLLEMRNG